jgi:hypothetical protein
LAREVDEKATRKALARIRRAKEAVERAIAKSEDPDAAEAARTELTDWEAEFMASVEERLGKFGSAFADPRLGRDGEALSRLQLAKLKEIENKAKGKGSGFNRGSSFKSKGSSFKRKNPPRRSNTRDIHDDMPEAETPEAEDASETPEGARGFKPKLVEPVAAKPEAPSLSEQAAPKPPPKPGLRVIKGGKDEN